MSKFIKRYNRKYDENRGRSLNGPDFITLYKIKLDKQRIIPLHESISKTNLMIRSKNPNIKDCA